MRIACTALLFALATAAPHAARAGASALCPLDLAEARFDLGTLEEAERIAPIDLAEAQAIVELLEPLWERRLTERPRYLAWKHRRDTRRGLAARTKTERQQGQARLDLLQRECAQAEGGVAEAAGRYAALGCTLLQHDAKFATVDVAYRREVLDGKNELRREDVATKQELLAAHYAHERARAALDSRRARARRCKASLPGSE